MQELSGRLEAQPLIHRNRLATGMDGHTKGSELCCVPASGVHERRADPLAALLRHDEDALDVRR
ncbi:hypothetical protein OCAE111667_01165 [Occultella aeris]|uniref:Uncharacterized protein n=1 Tax=Occultella aeris TaxID=2761496 RepID=A0A7M4DT31_9MICO|nr:hypothetical protein HALOF300_05333 [Occultella aeris]